jgi:hypothetical protein
MLTVIEQHEPGPVITDIRMPPSAATRAPRPLPGCNPAVDTPAGVGVRAYTSITD